MCSCCQSSASTVLRRRVPSLDALPGFYAGFDCASRVAMLLCVQPLSTIAAIRAFGLEETAGKTES